MTHPTEPQHDEDFPTQADIDAWTTRERQRRQQWAQGPTPEQAALWATLERERRLAEQPPHAARARTLRVGRSLRLCAAGALRLLLTTSVRDALEYLVDEGLDWETRYDPWSGRRRPR